MTSPPQDPPPSDTPVAVHNGTLTRDQIDEALIPAQIDTASGEPYRTRTFQCAPGVERTPNGRLWATFYGDNVTSQEGPHNFAMLVASDDDGNTWSDVKAVIDPPGNVRAYDACLWVDPQGRLWWFRSQSYHWFDGRAGVFAAYTEDPDAEHPTWSESRRIAHGVMMNKPTVLSSGAWVLPVALWAVREPGVVATLDRLGLTWVDEAQADQLGFGDLRDERNVNAVVSEDNGRTFRLVGGVDMARRNFAEHMFVERRDGSLWLLLRTVLGIGQSSSTDGGRTWSPGEPLLDGVKGSGTRFFIRRLRSGNLLLVYHEGDKRTNLTAFLSQDDGKTWPHSLLLDDRDQVAYPDGTQSEDGTIYVVYDHERYTDREVLMAVFSEDDIIKGACASLASRLRIIVNNGR